MPRPNSPGLVRKAEVDSGHIQHALRFTADDTRDTYISPARHYASGLTSQTIPPMGQRFRLKATFDISGYPAPIPVILLAMKQYGIILADNGSNWYINGVPDSNWDDDMLVSQLAKVKGSDFEAVNVSSLMLSPELRSGAPSPDLAAAHVAPAAPLSLVSIRKLMGEPILWCVRRSRTHHKIGTPSYFRTGS